MSFPVPGRSAWGKADPEDGFHALEAHSTDVAAVFERICLLPILNAHLKRLANRALLPADISRLGALVYLHDIGKLMPGFQAKARPDLPVRPDIDHSIAGGMLIGHAFNDPDFCLAPVIAEIGTWGDGFQDLLFAIFAHHGRPVSPMSELNPIFRVPGYDIAQAAEPYLAMWRAAFPETSPAAPLPATPGFVHMIAGLTALADWIGSDRRFFPFVAAPGADYPGLARARAKNALRTIGFDLAGRVPATGFADVAGSAFSPRPAQRLVGEADPFDSPLVLLEAETGSGKTEAALWRYALLASAGLVSGLYFAVPTRAAARQLHRRVNAALARMFGAEAPEAVLAIPGQIVAGEATGYRLPGFETRWDDTPGQAPARWAAEQATRFLAAPIAVGTVDQAMLAGLRVKHAPLRGSALSRSLLVIDEVHSSDRFQTEILAPLLRGHLAAGGQAMLMSATLGSAARARFMGTAQPDLETAIRTAYPALWSLGHTAPAEAAPDGRRKPVRMERLATMDARRTAEEAIRRARAGARVLVIRNTVDMAVATFEAVAEAGAADLLMPCEGGPALHHSRFAAEDRALLDSAVEAILSPAPDRPLLGAIVIGSQTLEQSLDICSDFLITDLCPVDVLLQRIGRLHRHDLPRPAGFETAHCLVLCPENGLDRLATTPAFENGLGAWKPCDGTTQGIYLDLPCIALTERLLDEIPVWDIPSMNRELVERATHPEARQAEIARRGEAWENYERQLLGRTMAQRGQAGQWILDRSQPFPAAFPGKDEIVQTRLGEQGPVLTFAPGTTGPFGREITTLTLPPRWVHGDIPDHPIAPETGPDGLHFSAGELHFVYGRTGLMQENKKGEPA